MNITWDVSNDVDVEFHDAVSEIDSTLKEEKTPLRLHSLQNATDMEAALGKVTQQLEQSVANNSLAIDPQFAVLDTKNLDLSKTAPETRDISNPLVESDYSPHGYDEQVNC